jgi:integrase
VTPRRIETWRDAFIDSGQSRRNTNKIHAVVHAILQRGVERHGLQRNAAAQVKKLRESYDARFDFYSPAEVAKLAVHAANQTDAAIYRTAAFSGLRMGELIALLWEDVDFDNHSLRVWEGYKRGEVGQPKSRKSRTVPMVDDVARVLAALKQRGHDTAPKDLVFPSDEGGHQDPSALRRRYKKALKAAKLRPLRFHDLRHTFGSLAINTATIVQVQAWMGHADIKTTMRYLHHKSRADDARLLSAAFRPDEAGDLDEAA